MTDDDIKAIRDWCKSDERTWSYSHTEEDDGEDVIFVSMYEFEEFADYFMGLKQTSPSGWNDHIRPNYYVDLASRIDDEWSSASDEYKVARDRHKVVAWMEKPKPWEGGQE